MYNAYFHECNLKFVFYEYNLESLDEKLFYLLNIVRSIIFLRTSTACTVLHFHISMKGVEVLLNGNRKSDI